MSIIKPSSVFKGSNWSSGDVRAFVKDQLLFAVDTVADVNDNDFEQARWNGAARLDADLGMACDSSGKRLGARDVAGLDHERGRAGRLPRAQRAAIRSRPRQGRGARGGDRMTWLPTIAAVAFLVALAAGADLKGRKGTMHYEILLAVAAGIMIGNAIFLSRTCRRMVEMERCMQGLISELLSERRIVMADENDPFGETVSLRGKELTN